MPELVEREVPIEAEALLPGSKGSLSCALRQPRAAASPAASSPAAAEERRARVQALPALLLPCQKPAELAPKALW